MALQAGSIAPMELAQQRWSVTPVARHRAKNPGGSGFREEMARHNSLVAPLDLALQAGFVAPIELARQRHSVAPLPRYRAKNAGSSGFREEVARQYGLVAPRGPALQAVFVAPLELARQSRSPTPSGKKCRRFWDRRGDGATVVYCRANMTGTTEHFHFPIICYRMKLIFSSLKKSHKWICAQIPSQFKEFYLILLKLLVLHLNFICP